MFLFGFFIFFSLRRTDKIIPPNQRNIEGMGSGSKELEIQCEVPKVNSNFTELLRIRSNHTLAFRQNVSDGKDMRFKEKKEEEEKTMQSIRKNAARMQLVSFLEDPRITDIQKIERIRDPDMAELLTSNHSSSYLEKEQEKMRGFCIEAGGFWKDWDDAIFLFL